MLLTTIKNILHESHQKRFLLIFHGIWGVVFFMHILREGVLLAFATHAVSYSVSLLFGLVVLKFIDKLGSLYALALLFLSLLPLLFVVWTPAFFVFLGFSTIFCLVGISTFYVAYWYRYSYLKSYFFRNTPSEGTSLDMLANSSDVSLGEMGERQKQKILRLWPIAQAILVYFYLSTFYSFSEGFGSLSLMVFFFPPIILFAGIFPFLWLRTNPRRTNLRFFFLFTSLAMMGWSSFFALPGMAYNLTEKYLQDELFSLSETKAYSVSTDIYYENGKALGYVVTVNSKLNAPNAFFTIQFSPVIKTRSLAAMGAAPASYQFDGSLLTTSFSRREERCEYSHSDGTTCRWIFLPDMVQSRENGEKPDSIKELCALQSPVTLIDEVCHVNNILIQPFLYDQAGEKRYASIVPPMSYGNMQAGGVSYISTASGGVGDRYEPEFYDVDQWEDLFDGEKLNLYVMMLKHATVLGLDKPKLFLGETISGYQKFPEVFPIQKFDKNMFNNATLFPPCEMTELREINQAPLEECQNDGASKMDIDSLVGEPLITKSGLVYLRGAEGQGSENQEIPNDVQTERKSSVDSGLENFAKSLPGYEYVSSGSEEKDESFLYLMGVRYETPKGKRQSLSYFPDGGQYRDRAAGAVSILSYPDESIPRNLLSLLAKESSLNPNGNFKNEFVMSMSISGPAADHSSKIILWVHGKQLLIIDGSEDFRKAAAAHFSKRFPADFSPV